MPLSVPRPPFVETFLAFHVGKKYTPVKGNEIWPLNCKTIASMLEVTGK